MDEEFSLSEMAKSGSFLCLSKKTITNTLISSISCVIFVSLLYLLLIFLNLTTLVEVGSIFHVIGYLSALVLISAPIGIYGASKGSYCALFIHFIVASYHLYGLILYICLNIKSWSQAHDDAQKPPLSQNHGTLYELLGGDLTLHQITSSAYATVVFLTLIMTSMKLISTTLQLEPARVIVVDNNPLD